MASVVKSLRFARPPLTGLLNKIPHKVLDSGLTDEKLKIISDQMLEWQDKAVYLGLSVNDIEDIKVDFKTNKEQKFEMMKMWREKKAYEATLRQLIMISRQHGWINFARRFCGKLGYYSKEGSYIPNKYKCRYS